MVGVKSAAVAIAIAVTATASSGFAEARTPFVSAVRAKALRDCNVAAARFTQYLWGVWELYVYRACIARRGQPE